MSRLRLALVAFLFSSSACAQVAGQVCTDVVGNLVEVAVVGAVELAMSTEPYTPPAYAAPVYVYVPAAPRQEVLTGGRASAPSSPGGIPAEQELRAARQREARRQRALAEQERRLRLSVSEQQLSTLPR
jgi:hypothetical protein